VGRKRDPMSRRSRAEKRRAQKAAQAGASLSSRSEPNDRVIERREAFSFLRHSETEGRQGTIDQDIHDGIGQLHALGYLDGHGHDPKELRDIGREYAELYWERYEATAPTTGQFERRSRGTGDPPPKTRRYERFDKLDNAMSLHGMERTAIHMLLTNNYHSDRLDGWVQRLISYELLKRGRPPLGGVILLDTQTYGHDCHMLECAIRGLCQLMDAGLPARFERRAA
jgi:hypothetical protein